MMIKQKTSYQQVGMTPALVLILIGILVLLLGAGSFYLMQSTGESKELKTFSLFSRPSPTPVSAGGLSDSDDPETLEAELEATEVGDPDADFEVLDSEASGL